MTQQNHARQDHHDLDLADTSSDVSVLRRALFVIARALARQAAREDDAADLKRQADLTCGSAEDGSAAKSARKPLG